MVRDPILRRTLRRTLSTAGTPVEFREDIGEVAPGTLLFLDRSTRQDTELPALMQVIGDEGRVVILGDSLGDDDLLRLLRERPLDHMIGEKTPDELELMVTSAKLLSGDIFGLEKYLSWGAAITEHEIATYEQKRRALDQLLDAGKTVGARRQMLTRLESTADELLMNALYDAPAATGHANPDIQQDVRSGTVPLDRTGKRALLRYACDGRHFAVSVLDHHGALDKQVILDSILRARLERGRPREHGGGAGLGLYMVLSAVTRFIVNIEPGKRTEVVCLFDLRERGRDTSHWARSLHIFTSAGSTG